MDLLIGTFVLRPYVFGFVAAFLVAGVLDLGWRRTLLFGAWVAPLAWLSEFTSTRIGIPFGLYQYTGTTRGQELFVADVPAMDSLSFTFLTYAAFCLARGALNRRRVPPAVLALASGVLMMLLDVVIDPVALRGDQWFLGLLFSYADPGVYFGVPLSNFAGWMVLGTLSVGGYVCWSGCRVAGSRRGWAGIESRGSDPSGHPARGGRDSDAWAHPASGFDRYGLTGWGADGGDRYGRRCWPGIALYYAVLAFNLVVTGWIGEWLLLSIGAAMHVVVAAALWNIGLRPATRLGLEKQRA
ncbi:MAG: carotenoid biosynthesis protein [Candidatus Limnocylindria bacterium]